jgi:hypothetical protein
VNRRTLAEKTIIAELENGRTKLLAEESPRVLLDVIRRRLSTVTDNLYLLRWIPEQGEDLYEVLVDGSTVVHVEIPRGEKRETVFELSPVDVYRRSAASLTKTDRRKIEAALQLAQARMT